MIPPEYAVSFEDIMFISVAVVKASVRSAAEAAFLATLSLCAFASASTVATALYQLEA